MFVPFAGFRLKIMAGLAYLQKQRGGFFEQIAT